MAGPKQIKPPTAAEAKAKKERISAEKKALAALYKNVPSNKEKLAEKLIDRASFLIVSLAELEDFINNNGYVEFYQNGSEQWGTKKSPQAELYTYWSKMLPATIDALAKLVPESTKVPDDSIDAFIQGKKK